MTLMPKKKEKTQNSEPSDISSEGPQKYLYDVLW